MNTKEEILTRLRQTEGYLSGEQLSETLGVSRAAVWKAITALRESGYAIDSATNRGYRLTASPDVLTPEEIRCGLHTRAIGKNIVALQEVDSTNEEARRAAKDVWAAHGNPQRARGFGSAFCCGQAWSRRKSAASPFWPALRSAGASAL